jgi:hypothetical protein
MITHWHVMDARRDSVDLLRARLDSCGPRVRLILVSLALRGDRFDILATSGEKERAVALGARIVTVGHLADSTMQKIDARDTSFWAAVQPPETGGAALGLPERQRVKVWLNRFHAQVAALDV